MTRATFLIGLLALLLASCGGDGTFVAPHTLQGTWELIGYSDHGATAVATGTCSFLDNGTFSIVGTVTFPGEPTDTLQTYGTYTVNADILTLTTTDGSGDWFMSFSGDRLVLTLLGSEPATTMTMKRRQ